MTDGERLTAILAQYAIPCEKVSFRGKLDALAAGLGIQTQGRLMGDVLDDIAAKMGVHTEITFVVVHCRMTNFPFLEGFEPFPAPFLQGQVGSLNADALLNFRHSGG